MPWPSAGPIDQAVSCKMPMSRCGRSALSRAVASSMRLPTRALSTSSALRLGSSGPRSGESSSEAPVPRRVNPLVGSYQPRLPSAASNRLPEWLRSPRPPAPRPPAPRRVSPLVATPSSAPPRPQPSSGSSAGPDSRPPPAKAPPSAAETPPLILSRPPPPPTAASSAPETTERNAALSYAYDALSSSPENSPVLDFLKNKSTELGESRGVRDPQVLPAVRTKASAGRTVFIGEYLTANTAPTAVMAFRLLDKKCRDQKIRNKYHSQKFHERPGLKRKRLKSQRWRTRFKAGFKASVDRVLELRRQGW